MKGSKKLTKLQFFLPLLQQVESTCETASECKGRNHPRICCVAASEDISCMGINCQKMHRKPQDSMAVTKI
jgi:hypothetical protein